MTSFHELGDVSRYQKVPNLFPLVQHHLLCTFFDLAEEFSWGKSEDENGDKALEEFGMASWNQAIWSMF